MGDRAPAYLDPSMHFDALRLVALHEEDMTEVTSQQRTREKYLYAHLGT